VLFVIFEVPFVFVGEVHSVVGSEDVPADAGFPPEVMRWR